MNDRHDYTRDIATALRLIAKYGELCTWTVPAGQADGADPWRDQRDGVPKDYPASLAFFSPVDLSRGKGQFAMFNANDGDTITYTQVGLLAGGQPFDPDVTHTIERANGDVVQIVEIDKVAPAGVAVLYYVAVK